MPMGSLRLLSLSLIFIFLASPAFADFQDGHFTELTEDAWSMGDLRSQLDQELATVDSRKAAAVAAYNELGAKLGAYHGWCSTYGITALRKVIEGRAYGKMFSWMAYPFYHVYANDPYFANARGRVDQAFESMRTTGVDVGKCALTEDMVIRMQRDPRHFDPAQDEFSGPSFAYAVLAGNIRLLEAERSVLTELKGVIAGSGESQAVAARFAGEAYRRLNEQTTMLRARTLQGFEFGFRIPYGPLESYKGKALGHNPGDPLPAFLYIFERRAYYVNQARVAAGKLFEVSVRHFSQVEAVQDSLLKIIQEANGYPK